MGRVTASNLAGRIASREARIKELEQYRAMLERQGRTVNADRCTHEITELVEDIIDLKAAKDDIEEALSETKK